MTKEKGISTLIGLIIIIVAVVILFGGVFAWQYFTTKSEARNPKSETNPNVQNLNVQNQTAGWKTYSGYGISFKYPKEFGPPSVNKTSTETDISLNGGNITFTVGMYYNENLNRNETFNEVVNGAINTEGAQKLDDVTVDGKKGTEISFYDKVSGTISGAEYIPIDNHDNILTIAWGPWYGDDAVKIISTFKFTK